MSTPPPGLHLRGMGRPLPLAQVICFEADDNYTRVHVRGQRWPLLYGYTLGVMCQRFPFMARVGKSVALNPQHVQPTPDPRLLLVEQRPLRLSRHYFRRVPAELARARQASGGQGFRGSTQTA